MGPLPNEPTTPTPPFVTVVAAAVVQGRIVQKRKRSEWLVLTVERTADSSKTATNDDSGGDEREPHSSSLSSSATTSTNTTVVYVPRTAVQDFNNTQNTPSSPARFRNNENNQPSFLCPPFFLFLNGIVQFTGEWRHSLVEETDRETDEAPNDAAAAPTTVHTRNTTTLQRRQLVFVANRSIDLRHCAPDPQAVAAVIAAIRLRRDDDETVSVSALFPPRCGNTTSTRNSQQQQRVQNRDSTRNTQSNDGIDGGDYDPEQSSIKQLVLQYRGWNKDQTATTTPASATASDAALISILVHGLQTGQPPQCHKRTPRCRVRPIQRSDWSVLERMELRIFFFLQKHQQQSLGIKGQQIAPLRPLSPSRNGGDGPVEPVSNDQPTKMQQFSSEASSNMTGPSTGSTLWYQQQPVPISTAVNPTATTTYLSTSAVNTSSPRQPEIRAVPLPRQKSCRGHQTRLEYWTTKKLPQIEWMIRRIETIIQESRGNVPFRHILDVGGGRGDLALALAGRWGETTQITVVDANANSLHSGQSHFSDLNQQQQEQQDCQSVGWSDSPASNDILRDRVNFVHADFFDFMSSSPLLSEQSSHQMSLTAAKTQNVDLVVALHACGELTDAALYYATQVANCSFLICPCCYTKRNMRSQFSPRGINRDMLSFESLWWPLQDFTDKDLNMDQMTHNATLSPIQTTTKTLSTPTTTTCINSLKDDVAVLLRLAELNEHNSFRQRAANVVNTARLQRSCGKRRLVEMGSILYQLNNANNIENNTGSGTLYHVSQLEEYPSSFSGRNSVLVGLKHCRL